VYFDTLDEDPDFEGQSNLLLGEIDWESVMADKPTEKLQPQDKSTQGFYWKGKWTSSAEFVLPRTNIDDEIPLN
jgi:hypothetical protein